VTLNCRQQPQKLLILDLFLQYGWLVELCVEERSTQGVFVLQTLEFTFMTLLEMLKS